MFVVCQWYAIKYGDLVSTSLGARLHLPLRRSGLGACRRRGWSHCWLAVRQARGVAYLQCLVDGLRVCAIRPLNPPASWAGAQSAFARGSVCPPCRSMPSKCTHPLVLCSCSSWRRRARKRLSSLPEIRRRCVRTWLDVARVRDANSGCADCSVDPSCAFWQPWAVTIQESIIFSVFGGTACKQDPLCDLCRLSGEPRLRPRPRLHRLSPPRQTGPAYSIKASRIINVIRVHRRAGAGAHGRGGGRGGSVGCTWLPWVSYKAVLKKNRI